MSAEVSDQHPRRRPFSLPASSCRLRSSQLWDRHSADSASHSKMERSPDLALQGHRMPTKVISRSSDPAGLITSDLASKRGKALWHARAAFEDILPKPLEDLEWNPNRQPIEINFKIDTGSPLCSSKDQVPTNSRSHFEDMEFRQHIKSRGNLEVLQLPPLAAGHSKGPRSAIQNSTLAHKTGCNPRKGSLAEPKKEIIDVSPDNETRTSKKHSAVAGYNGHGLIPPASNWLAGAKTGVSTAVEASIFDQIYGAKPKSCSDKAATQYLHFIQLKPLHQNKAKKPYEQSTLFLNFDSHTARDSDSNMHTFAMCGHSNVCNFFDSLYNVAACNSTSSNGRYNLSNQDGARFQCPETTSHKLPSSSHDWDTHVTLAETSECPHLYRSFTPSLSPIQESNSATFMDTTSCSILSITEYELSHEFDLCSVSSKSSSELHDGSNILSS